MSRRQTVFFLPIDPRDNEHQDPAKIDLNVPRRARFVHSAWKKHQDAVFWVDSNLAIREGLTFYQTRSNAIILQGTLPAYCIPKVERLKIGEVLYERPYLCPRPVKGMYPAPHIHEHFTIHKWLRQTAYILTHNLNNPEHIANNCMNTTMHTDANIAQF